MLDDYSFLNLHNLRIMPINRLHSNGVIELIGSGKCSWHASSWISLMDIAYWFLLHWQLQHVDEENSYLCGYLKITGLTFEYPMLTTFFDGEIISKKYPFLTRKWDADEDVDRKHWVSYSIGLVQCSWIGINFWFWHFRVNFQHSKIYTKRHSIRIISITIV